jgi:hypothetical protein
MLSAILSKPYPFNADYRKRLLSISLIALFVFLFLYIFRPFGLNEVRGNILVVTLAYGAITFITGSIFSVLAPLLFPSLFADEKWNTGRETLFIILMIASIATGNMLLGYYFGFFPLQLNVYINILWTTITVAVIPVFVAIIIKQNFLLKKNLENAKQLSAELSFKKRLSVPDSVNAVIHAENTKDDLQVHPEQVYFLKAAENYVEVHYNNHNVMEKKLIRTTLKSAHDDLKSWNQFYRCHRTCVVNLEKVVRVTGNAQGYRLVLMDIEETAPVSRGLSKDITMRLKR